MNDRIYAIIDWKTPLAASQMTTIKAVGVIQTSIDTIRKSLDGEKAILKWKGKTPTLLNTKILWTGTHQECLDYLEKNKAEWTKFESRGLISMIGRMTTKIIPATIVSATKSIPWWLIAALVGMGAVITILYLWSQK
jgi:hypothetical protein